MAHRDDVICCDSVLLWDKLIVQETSHGPEQGVCNQESCHLVLQKGQQSQDITAASMNRRPNGKKGLCSYAEVSLALQSRQAPVRVVARCK